MTAALGDMITGEVYVEGLTPFEARELTNEIRRTLTLGHDLLIRAFTGCAWMALGYATWDAYCAGEFTEARMVRLDREQRREIVAEMREAGMSSRAIASGLGVGKGTVDRDISATAPSGPVAAPTPITGVNGKTYTKPSRPSGPTLERPFTDRYDSAVRDLERAIRRLVSLQCEEHYKQRHRSSLARRHLGALLAQTAEVCGLVRDLRGDIPDEAHACCGKDRGVRRYGT